MVRISEALYLVLIMSASRLNFLMQAVKLGLEIGVHSRKSFSLNIADFRHTLLNRSDCFGFSFGFA